MRSFAYSHAYTHTLLLPFLQLPKFPPRKLLGAMSTSFLKQRQIGLAAYINAVMTLRGLLVFHCPHLHRFLDLGNASGGSLASAFIGNNEQDHSPASKVATCVPNCVPEAASFRKWNLEKELV